MSTPEENKAIVRHYVEEACSRGNLEVIDEVFSSDFAYRDIEPAAGLSRPDSYRRAIAALRVAFPDFGVTFHDMVAEGDLVAYHVTWHGTHRGEWRGIAPTGKRIAWQATCFRRVVDGKIVEAWGTYDWLGAMQQLGATVVPPSPPPLAVDKQAMPAQ